MKKKMTADEFVRNNRGINGGEDLPREFLRALYASIAADEIRISSEAQVRLLCKQRFLDDHHTPFFLIQHCPTAGSSVPHERQRSGLRHACSSKILPSFCLLALLTILLWQCEQTVARCLGTSLLRRAPMRRRAERRCRRCSGRSWRCSPWLPAGPCCSRPRTVTRILDIPVIIPA